MWLVSRRPIIPIPYCSAFSIAFSIPNVAVICPKPRLPLMRDKTPLSIIISGSASGIMSPSSISSTYLGNRIRPCESIPAKLVVTSDLVTCSAKSDSTPRDLKILRQRLINSPSKKND